MKKLKNWKSFNENDDFEGSPTNFTLFKLNDKYINSILQGYLECALWTEEDMEEYAISDITDKSKENAKKDIIDFVDKAGDLLNDLEPEQIGHDIWLTRNGHGAGFWDRDLGEVGDKLTDIAVKMGMKNIGKDENDSIEIY